MYLGFVGWGGWVGERVCRGKSRHDRRALNPLQQVAIRQRDHPALKHPISGSAGESGGRADVRWLALHDGGGGGLAVASAGAGAAALQMNVSRYSVESFDRARHDHELEVSLDSPLLLAR